MGSHLRPPVDLLTSIKRDATKRKKVMSLLRNKEVSAFFRLKICYFVYYLKRPRCTRILKSFCREARLDYEGRSETSALDTLKAVVMKLFSPI